MIRKLRHILPRHYLVIMSQSFVRPRFDYCNIIYDKPNNESSCNVIAKEQCNAPKRNLDLNHSNSGDG